METKGRRSKAGNLAGGVKKLTSKIKKLKVAMLTTREGDGSLHSRPMLTSKIDSDGSILFFTNEATEKVREIIGDGHVNLNYADPHSNNFISVTGNAEIITDRDIMERVWSEEQEHWFQNGIDEPNIALLKVMPKQAEYWDRSTSKMVQLFNKAKAFVKGERYKEKISEKIAF